MKPNEINGKLQLDALTRHAPGDELPIRELGKKVVAAEPADGGLREIQGRQGLRRSGAAVY